MISRSLLGLDHVGWMVRDLAAGADRWTRLGFALTPLSPQMGFVTPGEPMRPWATANRCAMFRQGYLELIGIHKPALFNPWAHFMDRFEGAHICALRCEEADAAYAALARRTDGFDPPVQRRRDAPLPDGGTAELRFRNIFSRDSQHPEGRFIVIEHQTPGALWRPDMLDHPNGAEALTHAIFCADDPAPTLARLTAMLDCEPEGRTFTLAAGRIEVLDRPEYAAHFPGAEPPPRPCIAAVTVAFRNMAAAVGLMRGNGVAVHDGPHGPWIDAPQANGAVLHMTEIP